MVKTETVETPMPVKKTPRIGNFKMKIINNLISQIINKVVKQCTAKDEELKTDDSTSYVDLSNLEERHHKEVIPKDNALEKLPCVHPAISNAEREIFNSYHIVKLKFLHNYLNEFCYKYNRCYFVKPNLDGFSSSC